MVTVGKDDDCDGTETVQCFTLVRTQAQQGNPFVSSRRIELLTRRGKVDLKSSEVSCGWKCRWMFLDLPKGGTGGGGRNRCQCGGNSFVPRPSTPPWR